MNSTRILFSLILAIGLLMAGCGGGSASPSSGNTDGSSTPTNPHSPGNDDGSDNDDGGSQDDDATDDSGNDNDSGDSNPGDTQKPSVVSTVPEAQDASVDADTVVSIVFDDTLDPTSIIEPHAFLTGPSGNVDVDVSVDGETLSMKPRVPLSSGVAYTATVKAGIRNLIGNAMTEDYSWQFVVRKGVTGVCADFYSENFALIEGKNSIWPASGVAKPGRGTPHTDPVYKTCITRATSAQSEIGVGWVRNDYSRRQAFNADESRYLVIARYGRWFIHDTQSTNTVRELSISGGNIEPQWHPTNPDLIFMFDNAGGHRIRTYNVKTNEFRTVADLRNVKSIAGYPGLTSITQVWPSAARVWTRWEGSPSADARYWGLMVQTSDEQGLGMITYDMQTNTITGVYDYAKDGGISGQPDHISMSPSGEFVVPSWASPKCASGTVGTRNNPCSLMSFTRDFSKAVGITGESAHSDIGYDANGREVIVASDYQYGWVFMWDLATGKRTPLWYIWENGSGTAMHISAKNYDKPGWVLISTYAERSHMWFSKKIMAVELKADPRILNIAHTYNSYSSYWTEPHASVNRDFTRIMFNSNWGSGGEDMDVYMITLPEDAVPAF